MSDTVKLIIEIPKDTYTRLCNGGNIGASLLIENAIKNGTPLDSVKAEIRNEEQLKKLKAELEYARFRCGLPTIMDMMKIK